MVSTLNQIAVMSGAVVCALFDEQGKLLGANQETIISEDKLSRMGIYFAGLWNSQSFQERPHFITMCFEQYEIYITDVQKKILVSFLPQPLTDEQVEEYHRHTKEMLANLPQT
jgi:hypothetical protein